jgi:hypothetical protein
MRIVDDYLSGTYVTANYLGGIQYAGFLKNITFLLEEWECMKYEGE